VNGSARCAPERPLAPSSTNKAGRSVVSWLAEGSDTGPRIGRQQCVSYLPRVHAGLTSDSPYSMLVRYKKSETACLIRTISGEV
jgi:hypothetical protein